jgi:putative peptide zinc metalloprotease protein
VLYTDTAETWKLANRRKQLTIASAGVIAELTIAVFASLAWALTPEGPLKSVFFVLATTSWIVTLVLNASPFMRFDGYFVLSDLLDFPNLHERSSACARWWLRTTLFQMPEAQPEPTLSAGNRRWLIIFALVTWLYRLVVFLGIALLVYHFFYKLLGVVLMVVELWWFICKPVVTECRYIWRNRGGVRLAVLPNLSVLALIALLAWLLPISNQVSAPAILRGAYEQPLYAPFSARVEAVEVEPRASVKPGALLVRLYAPELALRAQQAEVAIVSAQAERARTVASEYQQERLAVLEQRLNEALAAKKAVTEEIKQQQLRAFHAGTVRDLPPDLVAGRWVNPSQLLMRIVSEENPLIEAYVNERQVRAIESGQKVRFYPARPWLAPMTGTVLSVDKSPVKTLSRPVLAATHGGTISVNPSQDGALIPQDAVFRVTIGNIKDAPSASEVTDGTVRIETKLHFIAENFLFQALSVLIRESGL